GGMMVRVVAGAAAAAVAGVAAAGAAAAGAAACLTGSFAGLFGPVISVGSAGGPDRLLAPLASLLAGAIGVGDITAAAGADAFGAVSALFFPGKSGCTR